MAILAATALVLGRTHTAIDGIVAFSSPGAHMLATAIVMLDLCCRGIRMTLLAGVLGHRISIHASVGAQLAGEAAAAATPARAGADAGRMLVLHRCGVRLSAGGAIVVAEMLFEVVALMIVAAVLMLVLPPTRVALPGVGAYMGVVLATTLGAVALAQRAGQLPERFTRIPRVARLAAQLGGASQAFVRACESLRAIRARHVLVILVVSAVHITCRLAVLPALLAGSPTHERLGAAIAWPFLILYAGALVPAPGGAGTIELAFAAAMRATLGDSVGAGMVWWRLYTFHAHVLAGAFILGAAGLRTRRSMMSASVD